MALNTMEPSSGAGSGISTQACGMGCHGVGYPATAWSRAAWGLV